MLLWLLFLGLLAGSPTNASAQLLIRQKMFSSPPTYVMNKATCNSWWNVDLFCGVYSSSSGYVIDTLGNFWHGVIVYVDPCWNRLVYFDQAYGEGSLLKDYGRFGLGIDSLNEPMGVKVISPTSDQYPYSNYYNIFVADRQNHRVQRLHYRWTTSDSGLVHDQYYTEQIWRPTDLDVSDCGTLDQDWDDVVWVACKDNRIHSFFNSGYYLMSYGSTGSGVGQFNDIRAIVCGKAMYNSVTGERFANNNDVYVLDAGNQRIVRLRRLTAMSLQWVSEFYLLTLGGATDLEVDAVGHIWVTLDGGVIMKFKSDLQSLGVFGSAGTGPNQFDYPVSIANTGGHLGGGDMMICEKWTEESGLQHYAISTDINDLAATTELRHDTCWSLISFSLADHGATTILIYNSSGAIVRHLANTTLPSGVNAGYWNGTNDANHLVAWGSYRIKVTASSLYLNESGQPTNTVTKETWVTLCQGGCITCGDANSDGFISITDAVSLIGYVFNGVPIPQDCVVAQGKGDFNGDGFISITDAVACIGYVFNGTPCPKCQGQPCWTQ
jgi:hypothetical protein